MKKIWLAAIFLLSTYEGSFAFATDFSVGEGGVFWQEGLPLSYEPYDETGQNIVAIRQENNKLCFETTRSRTGIFFEVPSLGEQTDALHLKVRFDVTFTNAGGVGTGVIEDPLELWSFGSEHNMAPAQRIIGSGNNGAVELHLIYGNSSYKVSPNNYDVQALLPLPNGYDPDQKMYACIVVDGNFSEKMTVFPQSLLIERVE